MAKEGDVSLAMLALTATALVLVTPVLGLHPQGRTRWPRLPEKPQCS